MQELNIILEFNKSVLINFIHLNCLMNLLQLHSLHGDGVTLVGVAIFQLMLRWLHMSMTRALM